MKFDHGERTAFITSAGSGVGRANRRAPGIRGGGRAEAFAADVSFITGAQLPVDGGWLTR